MKYKILFTSILFSCLIFGQEYIWPTSTSKQLTSNFGEFRDDHFHMGLDIRTNQSTGHPLYAISDGYISRISTSFKGYGKALYLKTSNGRIALYGHLTKYNTALENKLHEFQNENQSYFVNKYFNKDDYPVNRGDVIGFSGNSGGSMGPHLHFEIRNEIDQPLNPLTHGFPVEDTAPPSYIGLAVLPVNTNSLIDGSVLPKLYKTTKISANNFVLKDTISVIGEFALAVRIIDKIPYVPYSYQIEQIQLLVDSISVYSIKYDSLDFTQDRGVLTVSGLPINHPHSENFQKLYRLEGYPKLLIHDDNKTGLLNLAQGFHKISIEALDAYKNRSILSFYIKSQKDSSTIEKPSLTNPNNEILVPKLIAMDTGVIFQLKADTVLDRKISAFIETPDTLKTYQLNHNKGVYTSNLLNSFEFSNSTNSGFVFSADSTSRYEFVFKPEVVMPDSNSNILSLDSMVTANINNSFYDTTIFWIADISSRFHSSRANRRSRVYEISPKNIPFKNDIKITFNMTSDQNIDRFAIYRFDEKKSKWKYVKSEIDSNSVSANLNKPTIVTVFEDNKLPWIESTYPQLDQTIARDSLQYIKIKVDDILSGIDYSENNLKICLDDQRLWVAYQPYEKEISYSFLKTLPVGEHNLRINIQDRSGNSISKSFNFFVE